MVAEYTVIHLSVVSPACETWRWWCAVTWNCRELVYEFYEGDCLVLIYWRIMHLNT